MGPLLIFIWLPPILVGIVGIRGLAKKRIIISSKYEVSGIPVFLLSIIYTVIALASLARLFYYGENIYFGTLYYPLFGTILVGVTIVTLFFSKSRQA